MVQIKSLKFRREILYSTARDFLSIARSPDNPDLQRSKRGQI